MSTKKASAKKPAAGKKKPAATKKKPAAKKKKPSHIKKRTSPRAGAGDPAEILREFALAYPEAVEDYPWGERVVKVKGKVFVFLGVPGEGFGMSTKLPKSAGVALMCPFASPTGYGLGKAGWVSASFDSKEEVPVPLMQQWIDESYRAVAPKKLVALLSPRADDAAHDAADGGDTES